MPVVQAYKLLLSTAGSLGYVKEKCCPVLENKIVSADCSYQVNSIFATISATLRWGTDLPPEMLHMLHQ